MSGSDYLRGGQRPIDTATWEAMISPGSELIRRYKSDHPTNWQELIFKQVREDFQARDFAALPLFDRIDILDPALGSKLHKLTRETFGLDEELCEAAAAQGELGLLQRLFSAQLDKLKKQVRGSPLILAAAIGPLKELPRWANFLGEEVFIRACPLQVVVEGGDGERAVKLVEMGADPFANEPSCFQAAIDSSNPEIALGMLDAWLEKREEEDLLSVSHFLVDTGELALLQLKLIRDPPAEADLISIVNHLLDRGKDAHAFSLFRDYFNPATSQPDTVRLLKKVEEHNLEGFTSLILAPIKGNSDEEYGVINAAPDLKQGLKVLQEIVSNTKDYCVGRSLLHLCVMPQKKSLLEKLLLNDELMLDESVVTTYGVYSPLALALIFPNSFDAVRLLLRAGADPNFRALNTSPLGIALGIAPLASLQYDDAIRNYRSARGYVNLEEEQKLIQGLGFTQGRRGKIIRDSEDQDDIPADLLAKTRDSAREAAGFWDAVELLFQKKSCSPYSCTLGESGLQTFTDVLIQRNMLESALHLLNAGCRPERTFSLTLATEAFLKEWVKVAAKPLVTRQYYRAVLFEDAPDLRLLEPKVDPKIPVEGDMALGDALMVRGKFALAKKFYQDGSPLNLADGQLLEALTSDPEFFSFWLALASEELKVQLVELAANKLDPAITGKVLAGLKKDLDQSPTLRTGLLSWSLKWFCTDYSMYRTGEASTVYEMMQQILKASASTAGAPHEELLKAITEQRLLQGEDPCDVPYGFWSLLDYLIGERPELSDHFLEKVLGLMLETEESLGLERIAEKLRRRKRPLSVEQAKTVLDCRGRFVDRLEEVQGPVEQAFEPKGLETALKSLLFNTRKLFEDFAPRMSISHAESGSVSFQTEWFFITWLQSRQPGAQIASKEWGEALVRNYPRSQDASPMLNSDIYGDVRVRNENLWLEVTDGNLRLPCFVPPSRQAEVVSVFRLYQRCHAIRKKHTSLPLLAGSPTAENLLKCNPPIGLFVDQRNLELQIASAKYEDGVVQYEAIDSLSLDSVSRRLQELEEDIAKKRKELIPNLKNQDKIRSVLGPLPALALDALEANLAMDIPGLDPTVGLGAVIALYSDETCPRISLVMRGAQRWYVHPFRSLKTLKQVCREVEATGIAAKAISEAFQKTKVNAEEGGLDGHRVLYCNLDGSSFVRVIFPTMHSTECNIVYGVAPGVSVHGFASPENLRKTLEEMKSYMKGSRDWEGIASLKFSNPIVLKECPIVDLSTDLAQAVEPWIEQMDPSLFEDGAVVQRGGARLSLQDVKDGLASLARGLSSERVLGLNPDQGKAVYDQMKTDLLWTLDSFSSLDQERRDGLLLDLAVSGKVCSGGLQRALRNIADDATGRVVSDVQLSSEHFLTGVLDEVKEEVLHQQAQELLSTCTDPYIHDQSVHIENGLRILLSEDSRVAVNAVPKEDFWRTFLMGVLLGSYQEACDLYDSEPNWKQEEERSFAWVREAIISRILLTQPYRVGQKLNVLFGNLNPSHSETKLRNMIQASLCEYLWENQSLFPDHKEKFETIAKNLEAKRLAQNERIQTIKGLLKDGPQKAKLSRYKVQGALIEYWKGRVSTHGDELGRRKNWPEENLEVSSPVKVGVKRRRPVGMGGSQSHIKDRQGASNQLSRYLEDQHSQLAADPGGPRALLDELSELQDEGRSREAYMERRNGELLPLLLELDWLQEEWDNTLFLPFYRWTPEGVMRLLAAVHEWEKREAG